MDDLNDLDIQPEDLEGYEFMPGSSYELIDWLDRLYPRRDYKLVDLLRLEGQALHTALKEDGMRDLIDQLMRKRDEEVAVAQGANSVTRRR